MTINCDDWGELPAAPEAPKKNKLQRIMEHAGIGSIEGVPWNDPLMLGDRQYNERRRLREHLRLWRENSGSFQNPYDYVELTIDGKKESVPTWRFVELQDQIAYVALKRGASLRETAAMTHLDVTEVKAVAEKYGFNPH
jgi:hypothetical protein